MKTLETYTLGIGDRFGCEGKAQLSALTAARDRGRDIYPVWNKSHREHRIVDTQPDAVRSEADAAVQALGWTGAYYVDADHISLATVDAFAKPSDFFTLDVAEQIGQAPDQDELDAFLCETDRWPRTIALGASCGEIRLDRDRLAAIGRMYLSAVKEAGRIYRRIQKLRPDDDFVIEVSMDETDRPQTPEELYVILGALASEGVPAQTIAPRFSGRFNKGVDYVGDPQVFGREFEADVCVVQMAISHFGLPASLKLSVHSGSDKFSIYPRIREVLERQKAGVHLKTAGTTWLEELIGLAESGGEGLTMARRVYSDALDRMEALTGPYASVIDITAERLPSAETVDGWDGAAFAAALRHDPTCPRYNPDFRQLLHVAYGVAADCGEGFIHMLKACEPAVSSNVTDNLLSRHILAVFPETCG